MSYDGDGIALGVMPLARVVPNSSGGRRCEVRSIDELRNVLGLAYGPQPNAVIQRCHRGLRRAAVAFDAGDLALAGLEAVMLGLPDVDADGMARLAECALLEKYSSGWQDEPRAPAGQADGGQWTSSGGGGEASSKRPQSTHDGDASDVSVTSRVRQSGTQLPNGFYRNSAGGGVFYVPSEAGGRSMRPTEVHALDADAFQVSWHDSTITLRDRAGRTFAVSVGDLAHFNATTGRMLGVSIYAYPEPLAAPDAPSTPEEEERLEADRIRQQQGVQASEQSPSGRLSTGAVLLTAALPVVALRPAAAEVAPSSVLNQWPNGIRLSVKLGIRGERAVGITGPKVGIRIPGGNQLRIPDALDKAAKVLTEVKNVKFIRFTQQLRDFLTFCRANGYRFELWARRSTDFDEELTAAFKRGEIKLRYIPGAKRW